MTHPETLRRIVELCGPVPGYPKMPHFHDESLEKHADNIISHARQVLREERGVDVRWIAYNQRWYWANDNDDGKFNYPTELDAILAALEATKPVKKPSDWGHDRHSREQSAATVECFASTSQTNDCVPITCNGRLMRAREVSARLNAIPDIDGLKEKLHMAEVQRDYFENRLNEQDAIRREARAEAYEEAIACCETYGLSFAVMLRAKAATERNVKP